MAGLGSNIEEKEGGPTALMPAPAAMAARMLFSRSRLARRNCIAAFAALVLPLLTALDDGIASVAASSADTLVGAATMELGRGSAGGGESLRWQWRLLLFLLSMRLSAGMAVNGEGRNARREGERVSPGNCPPAKSLETCDDNAAGARAPLLRRSTELSE